VLKDYVSIIIPNYNRGRILSKAIESALNQTYKNIEIIIVDDNSEDNSRQIIRDYALKYKNIKYEFLKENKGANYCRNVGAKLSMGEYLAFLDSDDIFLNNKIEKQINVFHKFKDVKIVFTNFYVNGIRMRIFLKDKFVTINDVIFRNVVGGFSTVMVRKDVFFEVGGLDENLPSCQDWDFYIRSYKIIGDIL
jgi:glycosyltransferase involved in cell wall biosynthesis